MKLMKKRKETNLYSANMYASFSSTTSAEHISTSDKYLMSFTQDARTNTISFPSDMSVILSDFNQNRNVSANFS